jgi:site-specific DNA-adenine methylase
VDERIVTKRFQEHPKLEIFIGAGTISLRMAREILGVDRYYMYDLFKELVLAGAIVACSGNTFRATTELKDFLKQRRQHEQ